MTKEEWDLVYMEYHKWAPSPYKTLKYSCYLKAEQLFRWTGVEVDVKTTPYVQNRTCLRDLSENLWNRMVPISNNR